MRRESLLGGGTSVAPERTSTPVPWLVVGGLVLAAGVVLAIVLSGDERARAATVPDAAEPAPVAPPVVDPAPAAPPPSVRLDPVGAVDRLERRLGAERMFARATVRGDEVELRSELCAEPRLRAILDEQAADLRAQGVVRARCVAPHGAEVFTRPL